ERRGQEGAEDHQRAAIDDRLPDLADLHALQLFREQIDRKDDGGEPDNWPNIFELVLHHVRLGKVSNSSSKQVVKACTETAINNGIVSKTRHISGGIGGTRAPVEIIIIRIEYVF